MDKEDFFTFTEYMKKEFNSLTPSMEDYLEMIYRLYKHSKFIRVNDLASSLNVQPPSATKMVQKLSKINLINYEKYGVITLKKEGKVLGSQLLKRHITIENFLKLIGVSNKILEETEKIEHTINPDTLIAINNVLSFFKKYPEILEKFNEYKKQC